jgi:HlyD family secretion protein
LAAKSRKKMLWYFGLAVFLGGTALALVSMKRSTPPKTQASVEPQGPMGVSSLGRIQPEDGIVTVGARSLSGQPSLVGRLNVKEGDYVNAGQVLAVLDSLPQLEAALRQTEARAKVADARLKQVKAGANPADVAAQQAEIARLEVELANAKTTYARTEKLFKNAAATQPALERDQLAVEAITQRIVEAKERLRSLEVRQTDIDVLAAELKAAEAEVERTRVEARAGIIRAPYNGVVLKIHAWQGAEIGPRGILELAKVDQMFVIAEVAESDSPRVKVGQRAKVTGYSLPHPIEGTVERLGLKVSRNSLVRDNPVNLTDARIVEVRIRLDDSVKVRNLIDAQVEVLINPN